MGKPRKPITEQGAAKCMDVPFRQRVQRKTSITGKQSFLAEFGWQMEVPLG